MAAEPVRGCLRRRIAVDADAERPIVRAIVEDDFHCFEVVLEHRAGRVHAVCGNPARAPWSLCPAAAVLLKELEGQPLEPRIAHVLATGRIRAHCTHQYDLACLAVAIAARKIERRRYDIAIDDRIGGRTEARLERDDGLTLTWSIDDSMITAPTPFAGIGLKGDFVVRVDRALPLDLAEAAILLRRAIFIANGRTRDLDARPFAAIGARNMGGCFVMQPGVAERAARMTGQTRDFSDDPAALLPTRW